ncbi:uncharacterized protein LOC142626791 [Castanea sativa]|uniref:uncharacterized protein LOC142626791 n=1 Tax=Castanea sativa TaxID=21020 RepID=UPI003F65003E
MNLLVWNCCGLGNLRTEKELGNIIRAKDPSVVFLAETWADEVRLERVLHSIDFDHKWEVCSGRRDGGLVLFWKKDVHVTVEDSHRFFIDVTLNKNKESEWRFTGFYGEPETHRRMEAWNKLRGLNNKEGSPWLCAGDFNEICRQDEKLGGALRNHNQMQQFRDVIDECGFIDLGFEGSKFTWSKHFTDGHSVWERLDRGLGNSEFLMRFPGTRVSHLRCMSSDHTPLLINLTGLESPPRKKVFRFEEMWLSNTRCGEIVEAVWRNEEDGDTMKKMEKCSKALEEWEKNEFGSIRRELEDKKKLLARIEAKTMRGGDNSRLRELKAEIHDLMDKETRMWCQRSRVLWLKNGDKLFTARNSVIEEDALSFIPRLVTDEINEQLMGEFMEWEIQEALHQMEPLKAPGPDGMPPLFYQHFWGIMNGEIKKIHAASIASINLHLQRIGLSLR